MKIEKPIVRPNASFYTEKTKNNQNGNFQQVMAAQASTKRTEDSITIYSQAAVAEEATGAVSGARKQNTASAAMTPPALEILPTDSTEMKLAKLAKIEEAADYSGMSYGQIYKTIWDRYNAAFDGNMAAISIAGGEYWNAINIQFGAEVRQVVHYPVYREISKTHGISSSDLRFSEYTAPIMDQILKESLGYGGMSNDEIEADILQKYAGKDTLVDFLNMQGELFRSGVLNQKMGQDGAIDYIHELVDQIDKQTHFTANIWSDPTITQNQFDTIMNTKFDTRTFMQDLHKRVSNMVFRNFDYDIKSVLLAGIQDMMSKLGQPFDQQELQK